MRCAPMPLLLLLGWSWSLVAAEQEAATAPQFRPMLEQMDVQDGDTVVFLGDSITHQCLYTQYVEDYFYTRYPHRQIRFHNAGIGGDRAADALARFDRDVAEYKPRYVTVLLGMNDGGYGQWTPEMFATYERDMTELIERIVAVGATPVLLTPTMYDSRAAILKPRPQRPADSPANKYYNASLAYLGAWVREQAINRGLGFADLYGPLNNYTIEQRRTDPEYTFIPDAVHPAASGQFIMAFSLLDQTHRGPQVASIILTLDHSNWKAAAGKEATLTDLQSDETSVQFTYTAAALPWVVPEDAAFGYKVTRAGHRASTESLRIVGLPSGRYELKIDDTPVGTYTSAQLAFRVELEENAATPQYQQALAVALLNKERNEKAVKPLRDLWLSLKVKRRSTNAEDLEKFLPEFEAKLPELRKAVDAYDQQIYAANKPQPHRYSITLVETAKEAPKRGKKQAQKATAG